MKKILLVDDELVIRSMLRLLLQADDRVFVEASCGEEALECLDEETFDLIISDVIMPNGDGMELVLAIRRKFPALPVIMTSGGGRVTAAHYLNLAEKLGAMRVFEKPFEGAALRAAVAELLGESTEFEQDTK